MLLFVVGFTGLELVFVRNAYTFIHPTQHIIQIDKQSLSQIGSISVALDRTKPKQRNAQIYIRLFPLLEPPPFVSAFDSGY